MMRQIKLLITAVLLAVGSYATADEVLKSAQGVVTRLLITEEGFAELTIKLDSGQEESLRKELTTIASRNSSDVRFDLIKEAGMSKLVIRFGDGGKTSIKEWLDVSEWLSDCHVSVLTFEQAVPVTVISTTRLNLDAVNLRMEKAGFSVFGQRSRSKSYVSKRKEYTLRFLFIQGTSESETFLNFSVWRQ